MLLPREEASLRIDRLHKAMAGAGIDGLLVADNADIFYLTGRVYAGFAYIPAGMAPLWFVRRPVELEGDGVVYIRKPEDMASHIVAAGLAMPRRLGLELDILSFNQAERLRSVFPGAECVDTTPMMRAMRAVKTDFEVEQMRLSGLKHEQVYRKIPKLYRVGMTDVELQVEIERISRLEGCLGVFRISGQSMEIYMGNVLAGRNADVPAPYDFAMGGEGMDPSLPVGPLDSRRSRGRGNQGA